ncbi:LPS export ABC transporter periplasmic protein LptC [Halochromatium sp.]
MSLTRRELFVGMVLLAIGLIGSWLLSTRDSDEGATGSDERRPDYVVDGLRAVSLNAAGVPEHRLVARRLRHYPDDGSSELDDPVLVVYGDAGPSWWARSAQAWINESGDEILLEQDVRLHRLATALSAPIELRTSELLVLPEVDYAETGRFVEIEREEDWITGTEGMRAWLGSSMRIQLFGRARAAVAPSQSPSQPLGQDPSQAPSQALGQAASDGDNAG